MKKLIITTTAFLIAAIATAKVSENRQVSDFSKIEASHGVQVYFTQSNSQSLKVETDDTEKMKYIKTENNGKTLRVYIDTKGKNITSGKNDDKSKKKWRIHNNNIRFEVVKVYVSVPKVTDLKVSSGASIVLENNINNDVINLDASASGIISGAINTQKLNIDLSSYGDATILGTTHDVVIDASSAALCNTKELITYNAKVDASSAATVYVNTTGSLNADASSMAKVYYYGNPTQVIADDNSIGEIIKK
jgi:hypothetical protein